MHSSLKKLPQALIDLDKKAEKFDEQLKDIRIEIHNLLWELIELKKSSTPSSHPHLTKKFSYLLF